MISQVLIEVVDVGGFPTILVKYAVLASMSCCSTIIPLNLHTSAKQFHSVLALFHDAVFSTNKRLANA